ncbi:amino acid/polyamine transporter II [Metabacillus iocasae]|uniref:Membrane protein YkvI n=1 Tax=Priestia iocasae TaxID=2291674 RepID=A0ABS2R1T3_9BACI|nr:amino acid/polyamine transporter II [Metabacillus iocasae]MBM7704704.1 putative membrane protein YkvI [Metabacillus iocasae]
MKKWKLTLQVAATYIGTVVGAGFATGKEIVQFFTKYGSVGLVGILISGFFFIWLGSKMMLMANEIKADSYQELNNYLFGSMVGKVVNVFTMIILFGITSVMLASTGAIAHEQLGLWPQLGMVLTMLLAYISIMKGIEGIMIVNSLVVPMMLTFSVIIIFPYLQHIPFLHVSSIHLVTTDYSWALSPFLYIAFNLAMSQAVLVPLGSEIKDETVIKRGALLGGIGLTFMMIATHLALSNVPYTFQLEIPMSEVIKDVAVWVNWLFLLVIFGEIFTTLIGNVFGMARQVKSVLRISEHKAFMIILLLCFTVGQIGYGKLLEVLYPLFGYMGLAFIAMLCIKKVK